MVICVCVLPGSRSQAASSIPYYSVESPNVEVSLSEERESEQRTGQFKKKDKDTSTSSQQFVISTRGWIYHPALMTFSAILKPEFKQQNIDINGIDTAGNDATFLGFFVDTTFLKYKPYTVNLFANKSRRDFSNSLASDSTSESTIYRGQLLLKYEPVPTTVTFESKDMVTESFFLTTEKSNKLRMDARHQSDRSRTRLEAEVFDQIRNINGTEFVGERKSMYISNQYRLWDKSNVTSGLRFTDNTSGAVDSETALFSSQLTVRHRKRLKTQYQLRIEDRDEGGFTSTRRFASAELTHQLYENLTTTLDSNVEQSEFTEGDLDAYRVGVDFRYIRKTLWGNLNINFGHRERVEDDRRQLAFAEVRDESLILTQTDLLILANDVIDANSIIVTDLSGFPYVLNTDYIVTVAGTSIFISRNIAGGITDGEEVLVDYRFEADPPAKIATISDSFSVNIDLWSMLRLFYQINRSSEEFISGIRPSELADNSLQRTGAELRWRWSTTKVEVEDRDTTRTPTKNFRFSETLSFRPHRYLSLGLMADYNKLDLIETNEQSESTGLSIGLRRDFGSAGQLSADGFDQQTTGSAQRSKRKGMKLSYQWRYGAWNPSIKYAFTDEVDQLAGEARKRNNLYFEVSRKF